MIYRLVGLMVSGGLAYAMLKGWPYEIPGIVRACLALLTLLTGLILWSARGKSGDVGGDAIVRVGRKPGWMDYGAIGMGLLALECGFLWVLSAVPKPLEKVAVVIVKSIGMENVDGDGDDDAETGDSGEDGQVSGNWLWDGKEERELPRRSNLKLGMRAEVFVRLLREEDVKRLQKEQLYVRAFSLDQYERGVWKGDPDREVMVDANAEGWIRFEEEEAGEIPHQIYHGKNGGGRNFLTVLQGVRAVRLPTLKRTAEGRDLLPDSGNGKGYEYYASSLPMALKDVVGLNWEVKDSKTSDEKLRNLARKAAGAGGMVERLMRLERYLKENYEYSLVVENEDDREPMDNFLFGEMKGHCEFFATAGALMARELGVEARVAYGWSVGQYLEARRMYVFRARDAHAWVEVKVPGQGWVVMEPTPSGAFTRTEEEKEETALKQDPDVADLESREEAEKPDEANDEAQAMGIQIKPWLVLFFALGFGVVGFAILMIRRKRILRVEGRDEAMTEGSLEYVGYLAAWRRALKMRGRNVSGRTIREEIRNITENPEFGEDLVQYHYGVMYRGEKRDRSMEKDLEKRIWDWD